MSQLSSSVTKAYQLLSSYHLESLAEPQRHLFGTLCTQNERPNWCSLKAAPDSIPNVLEYRYGCLGCENCRVAIREVYLVQRDLGSNLFSIVSGSTFPKGRPYCFCYFGARHKGTTCGNIETSCCSSNSGPSDDSRFSSKGCRSRLFFDLERTR